MREITPIYKESWKRVLAGEALTIYYECSELGWDGYEALAISPKSLLNAKRFIDLLPDWAARPDLVPSPDGWISFEWRSHPNRILSVTPEKGVLIYAAALGPQNMYYGRISFEEYREELPPQIAEFLSEYF